MWLLPFSSSNYLLRRQLSHLNDGVSNATEQGGGRGYSYLSKAINALLTEVVVGEIVKLGMGVCGGSWVQSLWPPCWCFFLTCWSFLRDPLLLGRDLSGVSNLLESLGHTGRRILVLDHTLKILWHVITKKFHNVLSKFTILCWVAFTAILGCVQAAGHRLDPPESFIPLKPPVRGSLTCCLFPGVTTFYKVNKAGNKCLNFWKCVGFFLTTNLFET